MSDVRGYVPGQTGTLADVLEAGPELQPVTPAGPDGFKAPPSFGEMFRAARPEALRATPGYDDAKVGEGYAPIVDALGLPPSENPGYFGDLDAAGEARFGFPGSPSQLATDAQQGARVPFSRNRLADRVLQETLIVDRIKARRAKEPGFLAGVPDTVEGLRTYFEKQQAEKRAAGAAVLERGSGLSRFGAGLAAGGVESAIHDPTFLPSLVIGGGTASSVLQAVGRDALINGILAAGQLPTQAHNMAENDEHLTVGQAAEQVAGAAVFGGLFGGAVHVGAAHLPPLVFKAMPESVQDRWASRMKVGEVKLADVLGDMDNRELAGFARSTIGERMTPEERAAADTLERSQELGDASPFMPGPAGDAAHNASLGDAIKAMIDRSRGAQLSSTALGGTVAAPPLGRLDTSAAAVPHDLVDFFRAKGLDDARAYGIAAGIVAESGGDHTALNGKSGAFGLGQWLGSRKAALVERYGPNPTRQQQLEFLWHELQGGDPGGAAVLSAKDAGQVLDAYIRKFMRPKAGAETLGDLERGMAALGRRGELPEGAPVDATAGDEAAALQRQTDDAEAEAIALGREGAAASPERELDAADMPILKRELFDSDRDWADAQLAFYRSQGVGPNAVQEAAGRPLSAETAADGATQPSGQMAQEGSPKGLPDTRGRGVQYHGARGSLPELTEGYYNPNNIYGGFETFYTTDALDIAAGYGRRRESARVYRAAERAPVRFFDMEQEMPVSDLERLFGGDDLAGMAAEEVQQGGKAKLREVMDEMRALSAGEGISKDEVQERFDAAVRNLQKQGFGGMTHVGGVKTGREPHTVKIYFDAPNQLELTDLGSPATVRIDEPALTAFDEPGGVGAKEQLASLEHDFHAQIEQRNRDVAAATLERLTSTGKLPRAPMSLIEFLARRGGINDVGGDLRSMGLAKLRGVARRGERKLLNPRGMGVDEALEAAIDAGYFPQFNALRAPGRKITYAELPDTQVLLDAIDAELRGDPTYADVDQEAVFERARRLENDAFVGSHIDDLHALADEWGVALDEGTLEHALKEVSGGAETAIALHDALTAAAMRDLGEAVVDTGDLRYGVDNEGRPWDDEVNYGEQREPAADDRAPGAGERRSAPEAADAPPGRAVAREPEGPAGAPGDRRYQLDESSEPKALGEILAELDRERDAVAALRSCAEGGAA